MRSVITLYMLLLSISALCQTKPVKIVFDLTSKEEGAQQSAIRHIKSMSAIYPDSQFELVVYGEALPLVLADGSPAANDILQLTDKDNVSIKVCEGTMERKGVDKSHLLKGVGTVPDGILEIISKQEEGWGYIKETP